MKLVWRCTPKRFREQCEEHFVNKRSDSVGFKGGFGALRNKGTMQGFSCPIRSFMISLVKCVSDFKDLQSVQSHKIHTVVVMIHFGTPAPTLLLIKGHRIQQKVGKKRTLIECVAVTVLLGVVDLSARVDEILAKIWQLRPLHLSLARDNPCGTTLPFYNTCL